MMNATATEAAVTGAITPPAGPQRAAAAAGRAWTPPQRLPVWDERARKMGFPPSGR